MNSISNEDLTVGLKMFFLPYLEGYRNRVNELYTEEHENSDSFYFMEPVKLIVLLREKSTHLLYIKSNADQIEFIDSSKFTIEEFSILARGPEKLRKKFIQEDLGIEDYIEELAYYDLGKWAGIAFTSYNHETLINRSLKWGISKADSHESEYRFNKAFRSAITPSSELEEIDTDLIVEKVNNPSFEYEFGESVKAYNAGIYLAAATTGGIALENILRILIQRKTDAQLPKDTYIKDSLAVLKRNHVLSTRLAASVSSLRDIRNSNSHTNNDPVRKTTVDHLYATIEDLAMLL